MRSPRSIIGTRHGHGGQSVQSIRFLPIGLYGAVMGLAGLGLAWRGAAALFPAIAPFSEPFAELWIALSLIALALLVPGYLLKLARHPDMVRLEFTNPAQLGFCGALPVGLTLAAGGLAPYLPLLADAIWWTGAVLMLAFQVWAIRRWLSGGIDLAQVNGGWLIVVVGGVVVPGSGLALGHTEMSRVLFGISAAASPFLLGLVFYRAVFGPPLPLALQPSLFILLVPPSLIYANGAALSGEPPGVFLSGVFYAALVLSVALFFGARRFLDWPFGAPWWAFTFPLDALATAAMHHARLNATGPWALIAALALLLATIAVVLVLFRTIASCARGTLFVAPA